MSWDIVVTRLPSDVASLEDLPEDQEPPILGTREQITEKLRELHPSLDLAFPERPLIEGDGFSIEVWLPEGELRMFSLSIRGGGDVVKVVAGILEALEASGIDPGSETGLFSLDGSPESLSDWQRYRDSLAPRQP